MEANSFSLLQQNNSRSLSYIGFVMESRLAKTIELVFWFATFLYTPFALNAQMPCASALPPLDYPASAMESKISGSVLLSFSIDERGLPENLKATGDPSLTTEAKSAFRYIHFRRQCRGRQLSVVIRFRIDSVLSIDRPVSVRRVSETEYEIVSPAKNIVVISDPPLTWTRPGSLPVEVWHAGDDALTVQLSEALESAFGNSRNFTLSSGKEPGTLIVTVPMHVGWKEQGKRTQVRYTVEYSRSDGTTIGQTKGACWEDAIEKCAAQVLRDAKRIAKKIPPATDPIH